MEIGTDDVSRAHPHLVANVARGKVGHTGACFGEGEDREFPELRREMFHPTQLRDHMQRLRVMRVDGVLLDLAPIAILLEAGSRDQPNPG